MYQYGDDFTLNITQDGSQNWIGGINGSTTGIEGDGNTIDMVQIGQYHGIEGSLDGNNNNIDLYQGGGGDSGLITATITGDENDLVVWQGKYKNGTTDNAEGGDHTATVHITGNYNDTVTSQTDEGSVNQTYGRHDLYANTVGDYNHVGIVQRGNESHLVDVDTTGDWNDVDTYQHGNTNGKTIDIDISGDYNAITVDQRGVYAASATIDVTNAYGPAYNVEVTQQTDTSAKTFTLTGTCNNPNGCVVSVTQEN